MWRSIGEVFGSSRISLGQVDKQEALLTFKEIENILGFEFPTSAKRHRCWWANDESHVQAGEGWMNARWVVETVNLKEGKATFSLKPETKLLVEPRTRAKIYGRQDFAKFAREIRSGHFGVKLAPKKRPERPKLFDIVSSDASIVGEAEFIATEKKNHSWNISPHNGNCLATRKR